MEAGKEMAPPKLTRKELIERLAREFPEAAHAVGDFEIEEVWFGGCRVRRRLSRARCGRAARSRDRS